MAKLVSERKVVVTIGGEEAWFSFREPTNQELNNFLAARLDASKKGRLKDKAVRARCDFFDLLLTGVGDLEAADGTPVTPENKDIIPVNIKADIIWELFENNDVEIKNG